MYFQTSLEPVTIFYTGSLNETFRQNKVQAYLQTLPQNICCDILKYRDQQEQRLRLGAKLLLAEMLRYLHLDNLSLNDIRKSQNNKPCFPGSDFQFSLSHSGNICICAGTMGTTTGVDIEQIQQVDTALLLPYLTDKEQQLLCQHAALSTDMFYKIWTKKEAILKASDAFSDDLSLQKIETADDPVILNGKMFYSRHLYLEDGYACCIASGKKIGPESLVVKKIDLTII